jgi:hypothetical protein
MTAVANGWPFLVARGRRRGYRTVLAPEFLVGPRLHSLLADAPERSGDGPRSVELNPAQVGPLTLVYETKIVTAADIGGVALDEHGRELEIRYGIVLRGGVPVTGDLPYGVRERALASYRNFLADEDSFDVEASDAVQLLGGAPTREYEPEQRPEPELEPGPRSRKRLLVAVVVAGVVVVAVVIAVLWLSRPGKQDDPVPLKTPVPTLTPVPTSTPFPTRTPLPTIAPIVPTAPGPPSAPDVIPPPTPRPG